MNLAVELYLAELTEATKMLHELRQKLPNIPADDVWLDWDARRMVFDRGCDSFALSIVQCFAQMNAHRGH